MSYLQMLSFHGNDSTILQGGHIALLPREKTHTSRRLVPTNPHLFSGSLIINQTYLIRQNTLETRHESVNPCNSLNEIQYATWPTEPP